MIDVLRIRQKAEPILRDLGVDLLEVRELTDHGRHVVRLVIDREGGIKVGDCETVSRELETPLDVEGLIPERIFLEVSSPGLDRPLVRESDFEKFAGKTVSIQTREPIDGRRNYKGELKGIAEGIVEVIVDRQEYRIPYTLIQRARLVY